jgi:Domain of unknown function (DUF4226)
MATLDELRAAIDHVTACTGDNAAWRRGLSSADLAAVSASVIDPAAGSGLLAKIRAGHPTLFDPRTGAPTTPTARPGQSGVAADAMKSAEDALVRQNSRIAAVDLQVITAIANAHSETERGNQRLRQLQRDIEGAVRTRTDLDTPAGARDFQRFLIGKLREIGSVIETADLDSASKAALVGAWTALYRSSGASEPTDQPAPAASSVPTASPPPTTVELPPYGVDPADPAGATVPMAAMAAPSPPAHPAAGPGAALPPLPMASLGALSPPVSQLSPEPLRDNRLSDDASEQRLARSEDRELDELLDELLAEPVEQPRDAEPRAPEPSGETAETAEPPDAAAQSAPDPGAATRVPLPDGSVVNAPTVALAHVMRAALAGTPVPEAFGAQGITVPPPGSAVGVPVDPSRVVAGDVGMFMEHQALALDAQRAWLRGQVQPVGAVTGPSFLGWLHPPAPSAVPADGVPPPNRPAAAPGTAR